MAEEVALSSQSEANGGDHVSFSDVVRAHFIWDMEESGDDARDEFNRKLNAFETDAGRVVEAYWCRRDASAVALTRRTVDPPQGLLRAIRCRSGSEFGLYRVTDWATAGIRGIPDLLHDCDVLAIKATSTLTGTQQAVVMQWLLAVESHVLGFLERHRNAEIANADANAFAAREKQELRKIEDYYQRAGEKRGRLSYLEGMLSVGVVIVLIVGLVTAGALAIFGLFDPADPRVREFYACGAAGGIGAIVSVLIRMAGRRGGFVVDHELGRFGVTMLGAYRPLIGAVSGIIVYFLVQTPLVPIESSALTFPFYVVVAFLAGFSERWTKVVLSGAMRTIADDDEKDGKRSAA